MVSDLWFSPGQFCPQGTCGSLWRHFRLKKRRYRCLMPRGQGRRGCSYRKLDHPSPQPRII